MRVDVAGLTHVGLRRSENQDEILAQLYTSGDRKIACLAVADGMGGHEKGREASQTAISTFKNRMDAWLQRGDGVPSEQLCIDIEEEANRSVGLLSEGDEIAGTTLTLALISGEECLIGHVGDSRLYCYRNGQLDQITEDQTWEAYSIKNHVENTYGNALRQAIGVGDLVVPDTYRLTLQPKDWILVCSDGLYKMTDDSKVKDALSHSISAEDACARLVSLALEGGGRDNIGVCVARLGDPPAPPTPINLALVAAFLALGIVIILLALALTGKI